MFNVATCNLEHQNYFEKRKRPLVSNDSFQQTLIYSGKVGDKINIGYREYHTLPLSPFLYYLLQRRKNSAVNEYVFPGAGGTGHIIEQRKQMTRVIQESGVSFTIHDLRRTFITVAESLDIPAYALKRLVNHKMGNDVTAGYIIADVERLREPMQKITDHFLKCAGTNPVLEAPSHPTISTT